MSISTDTISTDTVSTDKISQPGVAPYDPENQWILRYGSWMDGGIWIDTETWNDA